MQPVRYREDKPLGPISNINYEAFVEDDDNDEFLLQTASPRRSGIKPSGSGRNAAPKEPYKRPSALPPGIGKISSDAEHPKAFIMRKRSKGLIMYKHPDSLAAVCTLPSSPAICGLPK